jgi:nucleoside-diphosphate-sugar epimerase
LNILITGITGFIGGHLCRKLLDKKQHNQIIGLIRKNTDITRYQEFKDKKVICKLGELTDSEFINSVFNEYKFDIVYHIAAIRGGRNFSKKEYYETNVNATKYIAKQCLKHNCKLIFCSSVGVFGAIPEELPPNEQTKRKDDNYYHFTKIEAEKELQKLVKEGLKLIIIRPSITYGIGDYGFPYTLIKLVDKGLMILPTKEIKINIVDVNTLISAFINAGKANLPSGNTYNIADKNPVPLKKLVDFISYQLKNKKYSSLKKMPTPLLQLLDFTFSNLIKNELWKARVELISKNWYYDVTPAEKDLDITFHNTIPDFQYVIDWYKKS